MKRSNGGREYRNVLQSDCNTVAIGCNASGALEKKRNTLSEIGEPIVIRIIPFVFLTNVSYL